jgi:hypothetical protein
VGTETQRDISDTAVGRERVDHPLYVLPVDPVVRSVAEQPVDVD